MAEESNTLKLYNSLRDNGYKLPEYDRFEGRLKDSAARETLYNTLRDNGVNDLPEFSAFETWLGYPMPDDLKQQQSINQENKPRDSFLDDLGDRFMAGTNRTLGSVANLLDKGTKVLENTFGIDRSGTFGEAAEAFNRRADEYRKESNRYNDKDFIQLAKEGDWGGALGEIFLSATESAPQSLGIIASGGTGLTAAGLMAANDKYDQLIQDNPNMNRGAALVNSAVTGLSEYLTECLGAGAIGKLVRRSFALGGKEAAGKAISDYLTSRSADFMAKHGIIGPVATEAMEEMINAATEYGTDLITGVQRDDSFGEAVAKAGVYGAAGGAQFTPMTVAANYVARRRLQNASAEETPSQSATQNQEQMREDAIQRGKEMPETEYNSAYQSSEQSRQSLSDIDPNLAATIDRYVNDESSAAEVQSLFDGLDETVRPLAEAYYQSQLVMRGITERNLDDAEAEVQAFADRIAPFSVLQDDGRRLITTAHFSEGLTEKDVYVKTIEGDNAVIFNDDGTTRMVSVKRLQNIQEQDADDLIARYRENALDGKNTQMEFRLHHHPKTQPAQPGLVIFNGDKAYILQERDERGDWVAFPAVLDTETGQTMAKKGGEPSILTDAEVLELQDLMYAGQAEGKEQLTIDNGQLTVNSETSHVSPETPSVSAKTPNVSDETLGENPAIDLIAGKLLLGRGLTPEEETLYAQESQRIEDRMREARLGESISGMTKDEATALVDEKEAMAPVAPVVDVSPETWAEQFGDNGEVDTPIGKVKMGEGQYLKLLSKRRDAQMGMIRPTLAEPDWIIEQYDPKEGAERDSKYLFVKTFKEGEKGIRRFESVTVSKEGNEVVVSNHLLRKAQLVKKMQEGRLLYNATSLDTSGQASLEQSPETGTGVSSEGKGTQPAEENQAISEENARPSADDMLDTLLDGSLSIEEVDAFVDANRKDVGKRLADIDKKKPVPGTNLAEYKRKRAEWQNQRDAVQQEADYWEDINNRLQESRRQPGDDAALNVLKNQTPQTGEELAAEMLADGSIKLLRDDYMRETGGGRGETRGLFGLFAGRDKGGMTIEQAGEVLMQADLEQGTNLFDQSDPNAGRNAIIEVLSEARTRGDLINYVRRSREEQARRAAEAEYNEYAEWCEANFRMSPEDYEAYVEAMERDFRTKMQTPEAFDQVSGEIYDEMLAQQQEYADIDAALAQSNTTENENIERNDEGRGNSLREGSDEVLPETQPRETGRTGETQGERETGADARGEDGAAQEGSEGRIEPVGNGPFGFIYNQFKGKVREAIDFLIRHQSGDLLGVFHRADVGDIDLVWGDKNGGLAHIIDKHINTHDDFKDINEASRIIEDVINNGEIAKNGQLRIEITDGKYKVSIRKDYNGKRKNWVVTALDSSRGEKEKRIPAIKTSSTDNNQEGVPNALGISSEDKGSNTSSENQISAPEFIPGESEFDYAQRVVEANKRKAEERKVDTNPTEAQKEAGNYKKGHIKLDGFDITIENPKGSTRSGVDANGNPWSVTMNNTYGYIRDTEGVDGDHIDVFLSDDPTQGDVFVIDQVKADGTFDEHKVMYGFPSEKAAREAYLANYSPGWQGLGNITQVSKEEFKKWVDSSKRKTKPFAKYKNIRFRFIGERGAANLDRAEEATTRMDNLSVARDMENAFNEKQARIEKLRESKPVEITGEEYKGKYELKRDSAKAWIKDNLRGEYTINDTNETVAIGRKGINKVTSHSMGNEAHLKSLIAIPEMIQNAIFITEEVAEKKNAQYPKYRYYVVGLKIRGEDYTVKVTIGVDENGNKYYDHALTEIEKGTLIDNLNVENQNANGFISTGAEPNPSVTDSKDTKLRTILQTNDRENARKIKMATGWERGADGKWRYETPDFSFKENPVVVPFDGYSLTNLGALIDDKELFKAYPELEDMTVQYQNLPLGTLASYSPRTNRFPAMITMNDEFMQRKENPEWRKRVEEMEQEPVIKKWIEEMEREPFDNAAYNEAEKEFKESPLWEQYNDLLMGKGDVPRYIPGFSGEEVLAHEIQHAIQDIEGFAKGGNTRNSQYNNFAGEVESRNVERRMDLSPEERRAILAEETEDVSREDQLFIDNALNNNKSLSYEPTTRNNQSQEAGPEANRANPGIGPLEYPNDNLGRPEHAQQGGGQDAGGREADGRPQPGTGRNDSQNGTDNGRGNTDARREDRRAGGRNHAAAGRAGEQPRREDRRGGQRSTSNDTEPEGDNRVAGADNRRPSSDNRGFGGTAGERRERAGRAAVEAGERLGQRVQIIRSPGEVTDRVARQEIANGRRVTGWYDIPSRTIYIYLPNVANESEAIKTVLHEAVGHKGLRQLLGEQDYDAAMMRLYGQLPLSERQKVADKAMLDYGGDFAVAMDEYLAEQAERDETPSWWNKVKSAVRDMLRSLGLNVELSDNDVKYLLWRSRKVLSNNNPFEVAEDLQMRRKLGIDDSTVRFREAKEEVEESTPSGEPMVRAWDRVMASDFFKMKETLFDYLQSVKEFQKLLARYAKSKILDYENAYQSLLTLSSRNRDEMDLFESKYVKKLNEAIVGLTGKVRGKWDWSKGVLRDLVVYVEAKHGIERNRDLAVRKGIESLKGESFTRLYQTGVVTKEEVKVFRAKAEEEAKKKADEKYKETLERVFKRESAKEGVSETVAEDRAKEAAKRRREAVETSTYENAVRDFKAKCVNTLYDRWENAKHEIFKMEGLSWEGKQVRLDEAARAFQWKDDGGSFGAVFGKDYSGLSSVFKSEDGEKADWNKMAHDYVKAYEGSHDAAAIDNLWGNIRNVASYSLLKQNATGLVDKKYVETNLNRFEYFVPLRGFDDDTAGDVYNYIYSDEIKGGNPVKSIEGRSSEAANPFGGLLSVAYTSITAGNKNISKQKFLNLVRNHDTQGMATLDNIWIRNQGTAENPEWVEAIPKIPTDATPEKVTEILNAFEEQMQDLADEGKAQRTKGGKSDIPYRTMHSQRSEHQVQVMVGGNRYVITVNGNPRVAQAINGLLNPDVDTRGVYEWGRKVQHFMSGAFTSYNPAFSLANLSRDTGYANNMIFINENPKYWWEFTKNQRLGFGRLPQMARFLRAYREGKIDDIKGKEEAKDARYFKEFMSNGGATGYTFIESQKEYAEKLAKQLGELSKGNLSNMSPHKWLKLVFDSFEFMGNAAELVNRFAAYKTSREEGRSVSRSISDAKEITLNFNRKGAGIKTYDAKNKWYINALASISQFGRSYILFWNASLQGKLRFFKSAMAHPVKALPSFIGGAMAMGAMLPFLNNMFLPMLYEFCASVLRELGVGDDDDEKYDYSKEDYYDVLSDYDRERNICLRLPGGYWAKIPVSPDMAIYMGAADKVMGNILGKRSLEIMDGVEAISDVASPVSINWNYEGAALALNAFPTVVQPVLQNMMNVNFMGNPIRKESINRARKADPEYTKVYRSASSSLVALSKLTNDLTGGDAVKAGAINWNPALMQNFINGYTGGFGTVAIGVADMIVDSFNGEKVGVTATRFPLVGRFLTGGDVEVKKRRVNANYQRKVVDFVNKMEHDYKGYERQIQDPKTNDFDRAEYILKSNELQSSKDFQKAYELKSYIEAVADFEKWLKEFGDNEDMENQLYELKLRALEIVGGKE